MVSLELSPSERLELHTSVQPPSPTSCWIVRTCSFLHAASEPLLWQKRGISAPLSYNISSAIVLSLQHQGVCLWCFPYCYHSSSFLVCGIPCLKTVQITHVCCCSKPWGPAFWETLAIGGASLVACPVCHSPFCSSCLCPHCSSWHKTRPCQLLVWQFILDLQAKTVLPLLSTSVCLSTP